MTEGMGTNVGAYTTVSSYGFEESRSCGCLSGASTYLDGGWQAVGGANSVTIQTNPTGAAMASAVGVYSGSGNLGTGFNGSAVGYTNTSMTTLNGYTGSINTASAGMKLTSTVSTPR